MHIQSCEYPKRIYNRYLQEYQFVPCGHCSTCVTRKNSRWVQRLKIECQCHKYSVFLTLTYNEDACPYIDFRDNSTHRTDFDFEIPLLDKRSIELVQASDGKVRVLSYPDIQKFYKRLRKNISSLYYEKFPERRNKVNPPSIRYWVTGEYGPSTFRPHSHHIIWFDSDFIAQNLDKLFSESWCFDRRTNKTLKPLGRFEWSYVKSNAAVYVAQYVNCGSNLPTLLTLSDFRPFGRGSRRPPIGTLLQSSEKIRKIFFNSVTRVCVPQSDGKAPIMLPIFPALKNRLFPKCLRYCKIPASYRAAVYKFGLGLPQREEFDTEAEYISFLKYTVLPNFSEFWDTDSFIYQYVREITDTFRDVRPLLRAIVISNRVSSQAQIFDISIDQYVSYINKFYDKYELEQLKDWYNFSEQYSANINPNDLVMCDLELVQMAYSTPSKVNPLILKTYGLDSFTYKPLQFDDIHDYQVMKFQSLKILHETTKTKKKNDYLMAHPELLLFQNI